MTKKCPAGGIVRIDGKRTPPRRRFSQGRRMAGMAVACIVLALLGGRGDAADSPIVLGVSENQPHFVLAANGIYSGPAVDAIRELFFAMGKRVVFRPLSLQQARKTAATGGIDGVALVPGTVERDSGLRYSPPLFCQRYAFLFRKGEGLDWTDPQGLSGKRIVLIKGRARPTAVNQLIDMAALSRIEATEPWLVFPMLVHDQADVAVLAETEARAMFLAEQRWRGLVEQTVQPVSVTPLHLAMSKRRHAPGFLDRLDDTIRRLGIGGPC